MNEFVFDWVLVNKLAIGSMPTKQKDFEIIKKSGIKSIFNLCPEEEDLKIENQFEKPFNFERYPLPDHKSELNIKKENVFEAIDILGKLLKKGPVFIHCYASVERSPLICLAWLMIHKNLSYINSLDYLKEVHKQTQPLDKQLAVLREIENQKK